MTDQRGSEASESAHEGVTRRTFVSNISKAAVLAAAAPMMGSVALPWGRPQKLAMVGTSNRGITMWGRDILKRYPIESDGTVAAIPTPPATQEPASEVERADDSIAASGSRRQAPKFS